jgi:hypothetical protein
MDVMVSREVTQFPGFAKSSESSMSDSLPVVENWNKHPATGYSLTYLPCSY